MDSKVWTTRQYAIRRRPERGEGAPEIGRKRPEFSSSFKAKVALAATKGSATQHFLSVIESAEVQLTAFGSPTGQLTEAASASTIKVDADLRAVSAESGHRCELVLGSTRVEWSISGSLDGADSEPSDVRRRKLGTAAKPRRVTP